MTDVVFVNSSPSTVTTTRPRTELASATTSTSWTSDGHVAALRKVRDDPASGCITVNLGTGKSTSVLELVAAFAKAAGKEVSFRMSYGHLD